MLNKWHFMVFLWSIRHKKIWLSLWRKKSTIYKGQIWYFFQYVCKITLLRVYWELFHLEATFCHGGDKYQKYELLPYVLEMKLSTFVFFCVRNSKMSIRRHRNNQKMLYLLIQIIFIFFFIIQIHQYPMPEIPKRQT